jgi:hypothetical protein
MTIETRFRVALVVLICLSAALVAWAAQAAPSAAANCFSDVDSSDWFEPYVCWMYDNGITAGYPDGTFRPMNNVSRAEVSVFSQRVVELAEANDDDTLAGLGCSTDQVAKWDGAAWVCADDEVTPEAGVASADLYLSTGLDDSLTDLLSQSITAPDDGYVIVTGIVQVNLSHNSSAPGVRATFSVSETDQAHGFEAEVAANDVTNNLTLSTSMKGVFPVSAGTHTFYLLGQRATGDLTNATAKRRSLTLLFVPAAYGTIGTP